MENLKNFYEEYHKRRELENPDHDFYKRAVLIVDALQKIGDSKKILDFGCGIGLMLKLVSDKISGDFYGVDISETAIASAKKRLPFFEERLKVIENEAKLPFPDSFFDVIYSSEVIEHIFDTRAMFSELNRVLKPEGRLIITAPYHGLIKNLLICLLNFDKHFDPLGPHIRFYTLKSLKKVLRAQNFKIIKIKCQGRLLLIQKFLFAVAVKE